MPTASIVVGHLEAHHAAWAGSAETTRTSLISSLAAAGDTSGWIARGAEMPGDEVVAVVLARLDSHE